MYILGSNVFPENGFTNPTWTIMTLGLKLMDHLVKKIWKIGYLLEMFAPFFYSPINLSIDHLNFLSQQN